MHVLCSCSHSPVSRQGRVMALFGRVCTLCSTWTIRWQEAPSRPDKKCPSEQNACESSYLSWVDTKSPLVAGLGWDLGQGWVLYLLLPLPAPNMWHGLGAAHDFHSLPLDGSLTALQMTLLHKQKHSLSSSIIS